MKRSSKPEARGFTLVELIIVIIILAILAALAIPQFTSSTQDARESTLKGDLTVFRNAIELYYHQHNSVYPGAVDEADGTTAVTGADADAAFLAQMTTYSDATGKSSTSKSVTYPLGPYVIAIPDNPLPAAATVTASTEATVDVTADAGAIAADGLTGWKCSAVNGKIIANNTTYASW